MTLILSCRFNITFISYDEYFYITRILKDDPYCTVAFGAKK